MNQVQDTFYFCFNDEELPIFQQREWMIANCVRAFNIVLGYWEHIADKKCAQSSRANIANVENIVWNVALFPALHQLLVFPNSTAQRNHPEKPRSAILDSKIMRSVPPFVPFQIRIGELGEKAFGNNIKTSFVQKPSYEESPSEEGTFNPTTYIPHIGQRKTFNPTTYIPHIGQRKGMISHPLVL